MGALDLLEDVAVFRKRRLGCVDDFIEHLDADQRVLVGGVAMEELVLHEAGEGPELGEETAQETEFVHVAQCPGDLALAREDRQKGFAHGRLVDEAAVDHVEPAAQAQFQLRPEFGVVLLGEEKHAHEAHGLVRERIGCQRFQFAVFEDEAVDFLAMGAVKGEESPLRRGPAAAAKPVADRVAEIVEERRIFVVIAHERLHPAQDGAVLVAETVGDLALDAQGQDVAGTLLQVMKLVADAQKEVVGAVELLALRGGQ